MTPFYFRITWFSLDENMKITTYPNTRQETENASMQFSPSHALSITDHDYTKWCPSFINLLNSILCPVRFTSLNISCSLMTASMLFKIIRWLPNLDSLRVESLSLQQLKNLSDEDAEIFRLISTSNKITKVGQQMKMELTEFLLALCPRIEHLEVACIMNTEFERFVRFILMETFTHIPYLHSLRFLVVEANDEMIQKLQNMIDSEKLLSNYLIKRSDDHISLQWNLPMNN
jgi:hypothetical protein